jgi:hypothetical protein
MKMRPSWSTPISLGRKRGERQQLPNCGVTEAPTVNLRTSLATGHL